MLIFTSVDSVNSIYVDRNIEGYQIAELPSFEHICFINACIVFARALLLFAFMHFTILEQGHESPQPQGGQAPQPKLFGDEELIQLIDPILKMDDTNQDGYIDYAEFVRAQQKTATN